MQTQTEKTANINNKLLARSKYCISTVRENRRVGHSPVDAITLERNRKYGIFIIILSKYGIFRNMEVQQENL